MQLLKLRIGARHSLSTSGNSSLAAMDTPPVADGAQKRQLVDDGLDADEVSSYSISSQSSHRGLHLTSWLTLLPYFLRADRNPCVSCS